MRTLSKEDLARIHRQANDRVSYALESPLDEPVEEYDPEELVEMAGLTGIVHENTSINAEAESGLPEEDLQKWARIKQKAGTRSSVTNEDVPVRFIQPGSIKVRFHLDSEDGFVRTVRMHQIGNLWVPCSRDDHCPACLHVKERDREDPNNPHRWKYESQVKSFCYATVFSSSHDDARFLTVYPVILLGPYALNAELMGILSDMKLEELAMFFTPTVVHNVWEIKKNKVGIHLRATPEVRTCEPLPEWYPPLSKFRFADGARPTKEMVAAFEAGVDAEYDRYRAGRV
jgi:hypothetical protein